MCLTKCIDLLGDHTKFLTLNESSWYWQVEIAGQGRHNTAFTSYHGLLRSTRMTFGRKNALEMFQRIMDVLLTKVKRQFAQFYLNDIGIFSRTPKEHIEHARQIQTLPSDAGLLLNLKRCDFFINGIDYLGHFTCPKPLEESTWKINVGCWLQHQSNPTELQSFMGLWNIIWHLVLNFACNAAPDNTNIRNGQMQTFVQSSDEETVVLETIKAKLIRPPVLELSRWQSDYIVDKDTWDKQIGYVLLKM